MAGKGKGTKPVVKAVQRSDGGTHMQTFHVKDDTNSEAKDGNALQSASLVSSPATALLADDRVEGETIIDLRGQNRNGSEFASCEMIGADLGEASMSECRISDSDLSGATLVKTNMDRSHIEGTDLTGATGNEPQFFKATLDDVTLADTELHNANFRSATFTSAIQDANLEGGVFNEANMADVSDSNMSYAEFTRTDFEDQLIRGSDFTSGTFRGTRMSGARVVDTEFFKSGIEDADFSNASMSYARITDSEIDGTDFTSGEFNDCEFADTTFKKCDFTGVKFKDCDFTKAVFEDCDMSGAEFVDCRVGTTSFDGKTLKSRPSFSGSY